MSSVSADLPESLIRRIANAAMGRTDLIPLWFGESDQPTAPEIAAAAQDSLARGETFYGPNLGLLPLREAIAGYQRRLWGTSAGVGNVAVTSSALNAILLLCTALVRPGDEVVVLTPAWPNLVAIPRIAHATVREVPLRMVDGAFALDPGEIEAALTDRTRLVLVNSPHNPTGWRMPAADMAALVSLLERRGIWLLADEVYSRIVFGGAPLSFLSHFREDGRILVVNSFSKTWAMTGWRLGWIVAPTPLVRRLEALIEFNTSCAPAFVQHAGIAALGPAGEAFVAQQQADLAEAREAAREVLATSPRIALPATDATFYLFPQIAGLDDGIALAERGIQAGVGIAPGEAFGEAGRGHVRLCFARRPEAVRRAAERLICVL